MPIRELPPLVVSQIAAGEVIERPASVVKELIENAIDAGAARVTVALENGGRDLIRVTDDGQGIAFAELALAVAPHATSKISSAEDLRSVGTLGFRGEALASIAAVSRLTVLSRPPSAGEAGRIEAEEDRIAEPRPAAGPPGTTVTVRNLFFNTPARRKFLRTDATEAARAAQVVEALALGHPRVGFVLEVDGRRRLDLPGGGERSDRALEILGRELAAELLPVRLEGGGLSVSGLAGRPGIARPTARHQHVYLNGRAISDRSISHAIREAYRGLIEPSRHPTVVLFLDLDPGDVDVNVHPAKSEVRFRNQPAVHAAVLRALRDALRGAELTPALEVAGTARFGGGGRAPEFGTGLDPSPAARGGDPFEHAHGLDRAEPAAVVEILPESRPVTDVLQVHDKYIVTSDEQGLLVIDQHALHERIMFEQLLEAIGKGNLESQRLLMPAVAEVDPAHLEALEELRPLLVRIGIDAEPIGPGALAVHGFPSFLFERNVEPGPFLAELLERSAREGHRDVEAALHETLDMMACKAAIKAGDRLTRQEIAGLLRDRRRVERASRCPHGRPTTLRLSLAELDRHFGRR